MIEANELRRLRAEVADAIEKEYVALPPDEKYFGIDFRKEETTVSDIVELVRRGQPVNGIHREFPADDDEVDENASDSEEFRKHDELIAKYTYWDDLLLMASEVDSRMRAEAAARLANSDPAPANSDPAPAPANSAPAPANSDPAPAPANSDPAPGNSDPVPAE